MKCKSCQKPTILIERVMLEDLISFIEIRQCVNCKRVWREKYYFGNLEKEHRRMKKNDMFKM